MTDLTMPKLSESMEEGTILRWLKREGENVAAEEDLVEIETDKATVTHAAEAAGTLRIVVGEGGTVAVGEVIARIGVADEMGGAAAPSAIAQVPDEDESPPTAAAADVPTPPPASAAGEAAASGPDVNGATRAPAAQDAPAVATPLARRVARAHGVELGALQGSGPRGRITRNDVLAAAGIADPAERVGEGVTRTAGLAAGAGDGAAERTAAFEIREPSRIQRLIARRMAEAKATVPDFEVELDVVMDQAIAMRAELKNLEDDGVAPSLNDFVVKACATALRRHPQVNASYADGRFKLHRQVNIGVAVASEDALIVPVVRDADAKSLGAIADEIRRMAARVRSGEITPPELSGATFTVSNLGMFGMTAIRPVINLPQAAILGVGAIREALARAEGEIVDRRLMTLTLTADHRILYGADAARFLGEVKALLESPLKLVL
ncbi:MAG: dihydrolipoamide acetyltransferase family protein [Solirubrobacteraceae bacterium]